MLGNKFGKSLENFFRKDETTENAEKKDDILTRLKKYGLNKIRTLTSQKDEINGNTKGIFSGALKRFKAMVGKTDDRVNVSDNKKEEGPGDRILMDNMQVNNEEELYNKIKLLLYYHYEDKNGLKSDILRSNMAKDVVSENNFLPGTLPAKKLDFIDYQTQKIIDDFKSKKSRFLKTFYNFSDEEARRFIENSLASLAINNQEPTFKLIKGVNERGEEFVRLISDDFIGKKMKNGFDRKSEVSTFLDYEKVEGLPNKVMTLADSVGLELQEETGGRIDLEDWRMVSNLEAEVVIDNLKRIIGNRVMGNVFSDEVKQWILDSYDDLKSSKLTRKETFGEYIERKLVPRGLINAFSYNNMVKAFELAENKLSVKNQDRDTLHRKNKDVGDMLAIDIFDKFKVYPDRKKLSKLIFGVEDILDGDTFRPLENESLRHYFYRLIAQKRGCLKDDNTVDIKAFMGKDDVKEMLNVLKEIVPIINKRILIKGGLTKEVPYREVISPQDNS